MLYVNSCCCTCLSTENLQNVHNTDVENVKLLEKLLFCVSEKDSIFECAPLLMCEKCCKMLQDFYNFKKTSLKNLDLFRNCLQQLIRNPFSDLRIQVRDKQNNGQSTDIRQSVSTDNQVQIIQNDNNESPVANVQIGAIVKVEQMDDNFVNSEPGPSRNEGESSNNQNFSLKIHNVESLNQNYNKSLAKSKFNNSENSSAVENSTGEASTIKQKPTFRKKTICHPCGKKFIRDDFFIKHILSCNKNDVKTKNSVLNWVSSKTRKLVVTGQMKINPTPRVSLVNCNYKPPSNKFEPEKTLEEIRSFKVETGYKKQELKKRKLDRFERMVCHLCKRNITARFFRRHFARCSIIMNKDEKIGEMMSVFPGNDKTNDEDV